MLPSAVRTTSIAAFMPLVSRSDESMVEQAKVAASSERTEARRNMMGS